MKTFLPKQLNKADRKWYHIDANGLLLWELSVKVANLLRWRNRPDYTPFIDNWAYVVITNCDKFKVTWNKLDDKIYYRHSKYAKDWLKKESLKEKLEKDPDFAIRYSIMWMIPRNKLKKNYEERLKLFTWDTHTHIAQKPEEIKL